MFLTHESFHDKWLNKMMKLVVNETAIFKTIQYILITVQW